MLIDHTHRKWIAVTVIVFGVSLVGYIADYVTSPRPPSGGTVPGLIYGFAALALMLFAALLGLRKRFPVWRVGRAQTWMRGHLWLGLLTLPLVFFHGGFSFGSALTTVLMILTIVVAASGIFGMVLQHYLPQRMTTSLPMETIYEQLDSIRNQLAEEADLVLTTLEKKAAAPEPKPLPSPTPTPAAEVPEAVAVAAATDPKLARALAMAAKLDASGAKPNQATVFALQPALAPTEGLRKFFDNELRPFLSTSKPGADPLNSESRARLRFRQLRTLLHPSLHDALSDLESICDEARQLNRQQKYQLVMNGWLLLHVPLSYGLLLLAAAHAVMAMQY